MEDQPKPGSEVFSDTAKNSSREISDGQFLAELLTFFPSERVLQLLGWALVLVAAGVDDPRAARLKLEAQGLTKSSIYRALADLRRFGEYLETKEGEYLTMPALCRRVVSAVGSEKSYSVPTA